MATDRPDLYIAVGIHWYTHPRFIALKRPSAVALWLAATAWSREHLTDGLVPDDIVDALATYVKADASLDRKELLRVGLLIKRKSKVQIRGFLTWQSSADEIERWKGRLREAGLKGATLRWHNNGRGYSPTHGTRYSPTHGKEEKREKEEKYSRAREDGTEPRRPRPPLVRPEQPTEKLIPMPEHLRKIINGSFGIEPDGAA